MRYYLLDRVVGGTLPQDSRLRVGAVIRVPSRNSSKPGPQWNPETNEWVTPIWVECNNPKKAK